MKKQIARNIIGLGSIDILSMAIPIVTMPILAKSLGPSLYGDYLYLISIWVFGYTIIDYGVFYTGIRELQSANVEVGYKKVYGDYQGLRFSILTLYLLSSTFFLYLIREEEFYLLNLVFGGFFLTGYFLSASWFLQGVSDLKLFSIINVISKIIVLILTITLIRGDGDFYLSLAIYTFPSFISGIIIHVIIRCKYNVGFAIFGSVKGKLIKGKDVFIGILAPNLYSNVPAIAIGSIYPSDKYVLLAIAMKVTSIVNVALNVVAKGTYPFLVKRNGSLFIPFLLANIIIVFTMIVPLSIFSDVIIFNFLNEEYISSTKYINILLVGMIFVAVNNSITRGYILPKGLDRYFRNVSLRVSILSMLLSVALIYLYGVVGAAIALTLARMFFSIDYFLVYRRVR